MLINKIKPILSHRFYCEKCDYGTSKKSNFTNHLKSIKHSQSDESTLFNGIKPFLSQDVKYTCENCNKSYKERSGLWRHKKICTTTENNSEVIIELLKQNKEFKELIIEQNKHLIELSKEKSITNTNCNNNITNNNSFNLNLFLNEQCKDALNIGEFVEQLPVSLEDLEETGRLGYAEGISRIFVNGLKQMTIYERPIHCSDMKREVLYIKDQNKWEKDDSNKTRLTNAIRKVGQKNMKQIVKWQKLHPNYNDYYSKDSDKYLNIINKSMCGGSEEETNQNYSKIAKTIIKNVEIPKK
jgi:Txe/YoeB family toxin of Txe-Axe toxin-antitoxin module